ncbi:MAG: hypothetical protein ACXAEN_17530 [Candidatus Thorarchaeota archaeon]
MFEKGATIGGKEIKDIITRKRRRLIDVIVTAVIFGFTLNILSDYIMSYPLYLQDSVLFIRNTILAVGSIFCTILLLIWISWMDVKDMSQINQEHTVHLMWYNDTGEPPLIDDFWAQGRFYYAYHGWVSDSFRGETIRSLKDVSVKTRHENNIPSQNVSESLVTYLWVALLIALVGSIPKEEYGMKNESTIAMSELVDDSILTVEPLKKLKVKIPGHVKLIDPKEEGNKHKIILQWHDGYNGSLEISIELVNSGRVFYHLPDFEMDVWELTDLEDKIEDADRIDYSSFKIRFKGSYGRIHLALNLSSTDEVMAWTSDLLQNLRKQFER